MPSGVVTVTSTGPGEPGGVTTLSEVLESTVTLVAGVEPNCTVDPLVKPVQDAVADGTLREVRAREGWRCGLCACWPRRELLCPGGYSGCLQRWPCSLLA